MSTPALSRVNELIAVPNKSQLGQALLRSYGGHVPGKKLNDLIPALLSGTTIDGKEMCGTDASVNTVIKAVLYGLCNAEQFCIVNASTVDILVWAIIPDDPKHRDTARSEIKIRCGYPEYRNKLIHLNQQL